MTDKEIKSNLEWLKTVGDRIHSVTIGEEFIPTVIDYINRLESENSNLTSDLTSLKKDLTSLKTEKDNLIKTYSECQVANLKEFAERLKEKSKFNMGLIYGKVVYFEDIDNCLKEMVGEDNG